MDSKNITVTNHRLKEAIRKATSLSNGVSSDEIIQKIDKNGLKIGRITSYYVGTNECNVELLETNKSIRCEILHNCLSNDANISFTPRSYEDKTDDESEYCLVPYDSIYCAVLVSDEVNVCLGYLSYDSVLDSDASSDEILLKNNDNIISITDEFINITSDNLVINGLPFSEPFLENYDDTNTLDMKLEKKQEKLVNQENIASINGYNLLDGGNIEVGGGGTGDYNQLVNKPRINNIELQGNKSLTDLGIIIPSKTSDLINDSDYITSDFHDSTKVDKEDGKGLSSNDFTTVEKQKLSSLENYNDSEVRNLINTKVDKISGKGLSSNDYTTVEKEKLANLENYDDTLLSNAIQVINSKISPNASSINKLTDTNFVNSSIATNTAYFIGTFESEEELKSYQTTLTVNDYAFVKIYDEIVTTEIKQYDRWKYDGEEWIYEYTLNNSSFTNEQWATINSGLNSNSLDNYYTKSETDSQIEEGMNSVFEETVDFIENQGYVTSDYHDSSKADKNHTQQDSTIKVTTQNYGDITQDTFNSYLSYDVLQLKNNKQDKLVSGTNIKTINNQNLLGNGNITIQGGGTSDYESLSNLPSINDEQLIGNKDFYDYDVRDSNNLYGEDLWQNDVNYNLYTDIQSLKTNKQDKIAKTSTSGTYFTAYKQLDIVSVYLNRTNYSPTKNTWVTLGNLAEGFRPIQDIYMEYQDFRIRIQTNGAIQVYTANTPITILFNITYII